MKTAKLLAKIGMVSLSLLPALTYSAADNNENNYDDNQIERNEFISTPTASLWAYTHIRDGFERKTVSVWGCGNKNIARGNQIPPSSPYFSYGVYEFPIEENLNKIDSITFIFPITQMHNENNLMLSNPLFLYSLEASPDWVEIAKQTQSYPNISKSVKAIVLELDDETEIPTCKGILNTSNDEHLEFLEKLLNSSYRKEDGKRFLSIVLTSCIKAKISKEDFYELAGTSYEHDVFQPRMILTYTQN